MNKIVKYFIVLCLVLTLFGCTTSSTAQVVNGSTATIAGEFMNGWGTGATDNAIRELILGYPIATTDQNGELVFNKTLFKETNALQNDDGSKTYTFTMNEGLKYTDETEITAQDYIFYFLLMASPQISALEATLPVGVNFVGYDAYNKGETNSFKGIRLIDTYQFSVTIDASKLPNYFEIGYFGSGSSAATALPMHVIAPSASIKDSDQGATIEGLTVEELTKTILDPTTGYRFNPQVTAGPYHLTSFDANTKTATLEINKLFKGNFEGQKPSIKTLVFKAVTQETALSELESGAIDFYTASSSSEIDAGKKLEEAGKVNSHNYPRNGYGYLNFHMNKDATQFKEIRQAINYALDKNEFIKQYSGSYAQLVFGEYTLAQWQFKESEEALSKFNNYSFNLEKAKEVLIEGGWIYGADGNPYVTGTRYKKLDDGTLLPAHVNWMGTTDNIVTTIVKTLLPDALKKVGIDVVITEKDFTTLLKEIVNPESEYTMFNVSFNFSPVDEPKLRYTLDERFWGVSNTSFSSDQKLADLAAAVANREPSDKEGYLKAWLEFQTYFNETLPKIPLFSNQYFDFYNKKIEGLDTSSVWTYQSAILYATSK